MCGGIVLNTMNRGIFDDPLNFALLVITNFFVGSMVGLERTLLPILGEERFGIASTAAGLSFIISFGFSKAAVNYAAGALSDRFGRKRILLAGWVAGLFVPVMILNAPSWWVVIAANVLLGINQGLAWSMTVNMKLDLARPDQRGLAVGLNEFAGYTGVAVLALVSGLLSQSSATGTEPFYLGIGVAAVGFLLSLGVKDTSKAAGNQSTGRPVLSSGEVFKRTTFQDRQLSGLTFAGLATNLKDGMAWGLFPVFLAGAGLSVGEAGWIIAAYPAAWGLFQLFTGFLSDRIGRKGLIVWGMVLQGLSLWMMLAADRYTLWLAAAVLLGLGTAMVYPTIQAAVTDVTDPGWRASAMGVYRFWRDSGYAFGALLAGVFADLLGVGWAMGLVALVPLIAAWTVSRRLEGPREPTKPVS